MFALHNGFPLAIIHQWSNQMKMKTKEVEKEKQYTNAIT